MEKKLKTRKTVYTHGELSWNLYKIRLKTFLKELARAGRKVYKETSYTYNNSRGSLPSQVPVRYNSIPSTNKQADNKGIQVLFSNHLFTGQVCCNGPLW